MTVIPLVTTPIPADGVQSAINSLIDQVNTYFSGLSPEQVDITGGTIDNTLIGSITPSSGAFTSLSAASGTINSDTICTLTATQTLTNKLLTSPAIVGGTLNNVVIGGVTPTAATFTTATATTFVGALTGNASTASALTPGAAINGVTFTGASPITVASAAGTLTGTTLASNVVASSLTSVGTITSGTWSGSFGAVSGASLTNLTPANISAGTAGINISGNAATATTVATNANLTGPITSTGNATAIASQTGTGTKFVMDTSPTLVTPNIGAATATSVTFSNTSTGGVKGTTTNDNAASGYVGEIIVSSVAQGSAVSLSSGTPNNVTSVSIPAGDWDIWACVGYAPSASATPIYFYSSISSSSATQALYGDGGATVFGGAGTNVAVSQPVAIKRLSLASTTTYYLVAQSAWTGGGTNPAWGFIEARRVR